MAAEIIDQSWQGHGLTRVDDGPIVRVPHALTGERVELGPIVERRGRRFASVTAVLEPSPHRSDPRCEQAHRCPGCPLRHLTASGQTRWKLDQHRKALGRLADRDDLKPGLLWAEAPADGYRTRAIARLLPTAAGHTVLGMSPLPGHAEPIDLAACPAQATPTRAVLGAWAEALDAAGVVPFDPDTQPGGLRHVVVDATPTASRVVLGFGDTPDPEQIAAAARAAPGAVFVEVVRPRNHGVLLAPKAVRGSAALELSIDGDQLRATLPAWLPHSPLSAPSVRAILTRLAGTARIIEVGCGIGTVSLALARAGAQLTGIDLVREAVDDARFNAARAGVEATFRAGRGDKSLRRLATQGTDTLILHGMRRPYGPQTLGPARALAPTRMVLLGPSAAAVARDLAEVGPAYVVDEVGFVDQLPGTTGLLTVVALSRR